MRELPSPAPLQSVLEAVLAGRLTVQQALDRIHHQQTVALDGATVDIARASRCRFGEVIYGEGKPASLIADIARTQLAHGQGVLITRLDPASAATVAGHFEHTHYHSVARTLRIGISPLEPFAKTGQANRTRQLVVVVTAGSTDAPVAAEAVQTLAWMDVQTDQICDVGVAGPQRLLAVVPRLRQASAIVVVAGMEAALASVVGGHVACPVIAVPTSVGYGTSFGGITALLGMLSSCASNVSVVGIDAGFKAGYVAGLIATQLEDATGSTSRGRIE